MKTTLTPYSFVLSFITSILLLTNCQKQEINEPANVFIEYIEFEETGHKQYLNPPNGSYNPDNPDFSWQDSTTWTGNMAQHVEHYYSYKVTYQVKNTRSGIAYETELDIFQIFENGDEVLSTIKLGNIASGQTINKSFHLTEISRKLIKCEGQTYWYE